MGVIPPDEVKNLVVKLNLEDFGALMVLDMVLEARGKPVGCEDHFEIVERDCGEEAGPTVTEDGFNSLLDKIFDRLLGLLSAFSEETSFHIDGEVDFMELDL